MMNAAITDGDWVVVRQQEDAENGEIVAAMLDGEATVKTSSGGDGNVWLIPHTRPIRRFSAMRPPSSARPWPCCAAS